MTDLTHLLPQWADRDRWETNQKWVVEDILARFDEGNELVVLSAPTGAGKSLLAEMVGRARNVSRLYLAPTLSLQDQYHQSFPESRLIKGKANYTPTHPEYDFKGTEPTCQDCDLDKTGCSHCEIPSECPYLVAREQAIMAQTTIANPAFFMGTCRNPRSEFAGREFGILDECHLGPSEVMRHVSVTIPPYLQRLMNLNPPERKTVESAWGPWFDYAVPHVERFVKMLKTDSLKQRRLKEQLTRLHGKLCDIAVDLDGWIYDYDKTGTIAWKPIRTDKIAPGALMDHARTWLAMSATVVPENFVAEMGWTKSWASVAAPSTFPAERRPIYFCPSAFMTKKNEETAWPEMATALRVVLDRHPDERILVHTHAYKLNEYLFNSLAGIDRPVFTYNNSSERQQSIIDYEDTKNAVLLATSLEQGYDGKGDLCRVVVVCKVPFPYLGDKQVAARQRSRGGQMWYSSLTSEAILQAVGRGMRSEDDHCKCVAPETRLLAADLSWIRADEVKEGMALAGFDENGSKTSPRKWRPSEVEAVDQVEAERTRITFEDGSSVVVTPDHRWITREGLAARDNRWVETHRLKPGHVLPRYAIPWEEETSYDAGWLAGFFDGEACLTLNQGQRNRFVTGISVVQKPGAEIDRAEAILTGLGYTTARYPMRQSGVLSVSIKGGYAEHLRFLGSIRPNRLLRKFQEGGFGQAFHSLPGEHGRVKSVENIGVGPIVRIQTSTRTYIAEGYAAHNCYILDSMFSKFYGEWKRLFAEWFQEALFFDSPVRFQVARTIREVKGDKGFQTVATRHPQGVG